VLIRTFIRFSLRILFTIVLLFISSGNTNAEVKNGLDFLNVPVGTRAAGMGGAFIAVADDASAAYWNPAGLTRVQRQILFSHNAYIVDMKQEYLSAVTNFGRWSIAGSFNIFDVGTIEQLDNSGEPTGSEEFRPYDLAAGFSIATEALEDLSLGTTVKAIMSDIGVETTAGVLFDVGAIWEGLADGFTVGMAVRNLGPSFTYIDEPFDAPLSIRGGAAYRFGLSSVNSNIVVSMDVERMTGGDAETFIGGEWYYGEYLCGRLGARPNHDTQKYSAGFGVHYRDFIFDYAYLPFKSDLGNSHRMGVTYTFRR
jgi:hypothetical protein